LPLEEFQDRLRLYKTERILEGITLSKINPFNLVIAVHILRQKNHVPLKNIVLPSAEQADL